MTFEAEIAQLNEFFFFREFSYSQTTFRPTPEDEVELSDHVLWIDDLVVVYQLKERTIEEQTTADAEQKWYERKVLGSATKQIRDTVTYLEAHEHINLTNHRGDEFQLEPAKILTRHKLVCYLPREELPDECRRLKFHRSKTVGVIHLLAAADYLGVVQTLLTPAEFSEYLEFREELIDKWDTAVNSVPEQALVGQYLCGDADTTPSTDFIAYLESLDHRVEEWDLSGIINMFPDRMTGVETQTDYYQIVKEIAKLKRNELRAFKIRFLRAMDKCRTGEFVQPYRFYCPRTGCGFLFIPLEPAMVAHRRQGIQNLTYGCKYDFRANKCIGVTFAPDGDEWYLVEWCYMEFPWQYDEEIDLKLKDSNPFRETKEIELGRYTFHAD
ncbi:MAG: hypothetical protein NXI02_30310 [Rhodobacteraceae bacterium]|nr:hypothetical protein [Paracoccaceae bacterium]